MSSNVKAGLAVLGWRVDTPARLQQAIRDFQRAWNLGPSLVADGLAGPATEGALAVSLVRHAAGQGDISANFSAREFACDCGGRWDDCQRIWIHRNVIRIAEQYRTLVGPFTPDRACRCPRENARVGGVSNSQHLYGLALDVPVYTITSAEVRQLGTVSGIGVYLYNGRRYVRHIDARHLRGSTSTPARPATWDYGTARSAPLAPRPATTAPAPSKTPPAAQENDDMADYAAQLNYIEEQGRDIARRVNAVTTEVTALKATVGVLANSQGLNPELVQKTINDAVSSALSKITLTTEEKS